MQPTITRRALLGAAGAAIAVSATPASRAESPVLTPFPGQQAEPDPAILAYVRMMKAGGIDVPAYPTAAARAHSLRAGLGVLS